MAFEIAHPRMDFENISPRRRFLALLLGLAALAGLVWCCVTAYNARPLDAPQVQEAPQVKQAPITPGAGARAT